MRGKSLDKLVTPGAGEYTIPTKIGDGPKYSMLSKGDQLYPSKNIISPGPAVYTPNYDAIRKNLSFSLTGKNHPLRKEITPGASDYNVRSDSALKVPSYKFGTESRDKSLPKEILCKPGPGDYNIADRAIRTAPRFSFGKEFRSLDGPKGKDTPGPGEYQPFYKIGKEGPKYTMSAKDERSSSKRSFIPGPGQYTLHSKNKRSTPSFGMGTSKREGVIGFPKNTPGPSQYIPTYFVNSIYNKSPNWSLGAGPKKSNREEELSPGAGNYNVSKGSGFGPKVFLKHKYF